MTPADPPHGPDPGPRGQRGQRGQPGQPGQPPSAEPGQPPSAEPGQPPSAEPGQPPSAEPGQPPSAEPGDGGWPSYLDRSLSEFLDVLSAGHAAPGGGSAAALTVALGASLCAMAGRLSARQLGALDAEFLVAEADRLRGSAASLVQADAEAYHDVVAALRDEPGQDLGASDVPGPDAEVRRQRIDGALSEAAAIPMEVLELAAQTARLAARLAVGGNPNLRGDAITAALLAQAGARAAAVLVSVNLAASPGDSRPARAQALLAEIASAVRTAEGPPLAT